MQLAAINQEAPNHVWVSDITHLYVNYKPYYLCVIIDLFARKVIGYKLSSNMELHIVLEPFNEAFEKRGRPCDLLFHSDQGSQFSSYKFRMHLQNLRVKQSFSNPGCPYDNAVVESFFRSLKAEEVYHKYYATIEEMESSIIEYIDFFNNKRPHQKLGYKTPNQIEEEFFQAKKK